jgi:hypothetical protein
MRFFGNFPMTQDPSQIHIPENLPDEVKHWLSLVSDALIRSFADDLEALVLFGSAAEGQMRASSDVNLLVVLRRFEAIRADSVSHILQNAAAAVELHPMFVLTTELKLAAESFAVKFDDIAHRRALLYGTDPFGAMVIPRSLLLHRVQQVLLNLTLRLRATYMLNQGREERLALAVADAAAPLRRCAHAILDLRGSPQESPKASLVTLASELGGDWTLELQNLSKAREELRLPAGSAGPLVLRLARLAEAMQRLSGEISR